MKKRTICGVLALLCCVMFGCGEQTPGGEEMKNDTMPEEIGVMIEDGRSDYVVVIGKNAGDSTLYAAEELIRFVEETTDCRLPLRTDDEYARFHETDTVISIGDNTFLQSSGFNPDLTTLNGDGFYLQTKGKSVFVAAGTERGVLYGVYEFLERFLGVRFLATDCTILPKTNKLPLYDLAIKEVPTFAERAYLSYVSDPEFTARSRMANEYSAGLENKGGGLGWYQAGGINHNYDAWIDPTRYPQLWHIVDETPQQICLTKGITEDGRIDESVPFEQSSIKVALESLKKFLASAKADDRFFMFGQMDERIPCDCPACQEAEAKYGRSGTAIRFCNILADEAKKYADENLGGREIDVAMFAYTYTMGAPVRTLENGEYELLDPTVKPRDNVYIRIANISADRYHSFLSPEQKSKETVQIFRQWGFVHNKFMNWTYHANYEYYFPYTPSMHCWSDMFAELDHFGTQYVMMQSGHTEKNNWQAVMENYVASKMLWDRTENVNRLKREFIQGYYGEVAAPFVTEFLDSYDVYYANLYATTDFSYARRDGSLYSPKYFDKNFLERMSEILENAKAKIRENKDYTEAEKNTYLTRIKRMELTPKTVQLLSYNTYYANQTVLERNKFINDYFHLCDELGVVDVGENTRYLNFKAQYIR